MVSNVIQVLEILLLIVGILAVGRIFLLVGDLQKSLVNLESTRVEITSTLKRVETVADATEKLMREELTPTLKVARETLSNVETTTRALAESTVIVRQVAGAVENAQKMFTLGGPIAQTLLKKIGSGTGGFFSGVTRGLSMVLGKRGAPTPISKPEITSNSGSHKRPDEYVAIPGTATSNPVLKADEAVRAAKTSKSNRSK